MATRILSTTIDDVIAEKLDRLTAETHRKNSCYVNQALKEYFKEIDDYELASHRKDSDSVTLYKVRKELEL